MSGVDGQWVTFRLGQPLTLVAHNVPLVHSTGRDALVGGFAGHERGEGHTGGDAAVGGLLGHEHKIHEEKKMEKQANQDMSGGGGNGSMGDKIGGAFAKMTGKGGN